MPNSTAHPHSLLHTWSSGTPECFIFIFFVFVMSVSSDFTARTSVLNKDNTGFK